MVIDTKRMFMQGDLAVIGVGNINGEASGKVLEGHNGILAAGSSTGHSHRLARTNGVTLIEPSEDEKRKLTVGVLRLAEANELVHDEHDPIPLPAGDYIVRRQREANADLTEQMVQD